MSQHEKENIISLISLLAVSTTYFGYIYNGYVNQNFMGNEELLYWSGAILAIIPIRIILQIVLIIVFKIMEAIVKQGDVEPDIKDERDKLIELKGDKISSDLFIIGFVVALLCVYFLQIGLSAMFSIIFIAGYLSEFIAIISKMYFYRKG